MLIHVTRFVGVQGHVTDLVKEEIDQLRKRISYGDGARARNVRDELREVWNTEFVEKFAALADAAPDEVGAALQWDAVDATLHDAVSKIEVKQINGTAKDALDYVDHPDGFSVIAVGGNKLSRGLTLEGLTTSYFLRTSRMYDTLMQMGRWFGYRPGYLDLCRLFTTNELCTWYRHIALAEEELRREFDYMAASGLTPENYGLRVRSHSEGLLVTALNKMCHSETLQLSYSGELVQTGHFGTSIDTRQRNFEILEKFLSDLSTEPLPHPTKKRPQAWLWFDVDAEALCSELLLKFSVHPRSLRLDPKRVSEFIRKQKAIGELTHWTVALVSNSQTTIARSVAGQKIGLTERTPEDPAELERGIYSARKANIQSPSHQAFDLAHMKLDNTLFENLLSKAYKGSKPLKPLFGDDDAAILRENIGEQLDSIAIKITQARARKRNQPEPERANGIYIRELRPVTHGLLLIYPLAPAIAELPRSEPPYLGLAVSFPASHTARSVAYRANQVLIRQLNDGEYED